MSNEVLTKVGNKAEWAAGGDGGGGAFVVILDTATMTYDKSFTELCNAVNNGSVVVVKQIVIRNLDGGTIARLEKVGYLNAIAENVPGSGNHTKFANVIFLSANKADDNVYYFLFEDGTFSDKLTE